MVINIMVTMHM